jgi:hypothetical protein
LAAPNVARSLEVISIWRCCRPVDPSLAAWKAENHEENAEESSEKKREEI